MPIPVTPSSAAGSEEKAPTSPAGGGRLVAVLLVLTVALAVAVPTVPFHGRHPMSQVWILSISVCSYVFIFLRFIRQSRWFYTDFFRLSYGPLLAFSSAGAIGSANVTFVLFFSMAWAAGNLGYSLAAHRLHKGTEPSIHAVPSTFCPTEDSVRYFNCNLYIGAPFVVLFWASGLALVINIPNMPPALDPATMPDEMAILMIFSYFGWIHAAFWLVIVALAPMQGFPLEETMGWLVPALVGMAILLFFSPVICLVSQILAVLCNLLLVIAMVAFLWYNLAIYMHFLATATPSTTTGNEDILHSKILEDKIGQVKSDLRLEETPSCSYSSAV